ncbi:MAG: hypothetical protein NC228_05665 [[Eubacterium] siraeum]|nr:hypothetical protein [[Eubacterium] siraeum]
MAFRKLEEDDFSYQYPKGRPYIPDASIQGRARQQSAIPSPPDDDPVKVYHIPHHRNRDRDIPDVYPEIDTDLGRDNLENDLTAADLQDL